MSDIYCTVCGEPWDAYGVRHGDMPPAEARQFLAGQGCPSCDFGRTCPYCGGSGRDRSDQDGGPCPSCGGSGQPSGGDVLYAARSELEWSDEDPILILHRRGLL